MTYLRPVKIDMRDLSSYFCQFSIILLHCHSNIHSRLRLVIKLLFISCLTDVVDLVQWFDQFFFWWDELKLDASQVWQVNLSKYKNWQWHLDIIPISEIMEPVIKLTWQICQCHVSFDSFRCFCQILLQLSQQYCSIQRLLYVLLFISSLTYFLRCFLAI